MDKIGSNVVENERLQQQAMAEAIVVRTETQNFLRKQLTTRALLAMSARRTLTRTKILENFLQNILLRVRRMTCALAIWPVTSSNRSLRGQPTYALYNVLSTLP